MGHQTKCKQMTLSLHTAHCRTYAIVCHMETTSCCYGRNENQMKKQQNRKPFSVLDENVQQINHKYKQ